ILPAMQQAKQPFWARLQLLARLTLNTRNDATNQPARLAQLDDGNDRAILIQGDEGPAQIVWLGHRGTPSIRLQRRSCHFLVACPIASIGPAVNGTAVERGSARNDRRLARRGLNDPIEGAIIANLQDYAVVRELVGNPISEEVGVGIPAIARE